MGNGLGGGDYRGINQELIGIWAGEEIQLLDISIMYEDDYQAYQEFKKTYQDITKEIIFKE
jgi:hypothetical protein